MTATVGDNSKPAMRKGLGKGMTPQKLGEKAKAKNAVLRAKLKAGKLKVEK